jgi:beta-glucosidase
MSAGAFLALIAGVSHPPAAAAATAPTCGTPVGAYAWCDTSMSADQRAGLLLGALTGDEKISLLAGIASSGPTGQTASIPRVGLRTVNITDDGVSVKQGTSTALPIPLAVAATFDTGMANLAGTTIANETRAKGDDVILGPTVNIMRTPLGGRTFESYGEDPYLTTRTAVSWIEGAQAQGVMAEVKHFCCNNEEGAGMFVCEKNFCSSDLDERTLREIYTPQFEAAVKEAHAAAVMCAYNRVNDDWACEDRHLLTDMLKGDWGFSGIVMSDWQSQHFTVMALKNGLDVEMPTASDYSSTNVNAALMSGQVTQADIDDHVRRFLRMLFAAGFFDRAPYINDDKQIDTTAHADVAQQIEESGMTLLKNAAILPLDGAKLKSIALIGPQADRFENGAGTENITPFTFTTPRQAITQRAGPGVTVTYDDGSNTTTAAAVAAAAGVAVVFASDHEGEYMDKMTASVDGSQGSTSNQDGLIAAIAAANPNTVVVLETGDPVLTPWRDSVRGILEAWYPGEEGGAALAHVLFGDVDPGGRLPVTFPGSATAYPTAGDPTAYPGVGTDVLYREGVFVGYRWYDQNNVTPAFPFGLGLSYTSFAFHDLAISPANAGTTVATVTVSVTNVGSRAGIAVPELYLGLPSPSSSVLQPPRQQRGYSKLSLLPGQTQTVSFPLDDRAFSYWDVTSNGWAVAPGCYMVMTGSSSRDLPLQGVISRGGAGCGPNAVVVSGVPSASVAEAPGAGLLSGAGAAAAAVGLLVRRRLRRRRLQRPAPHAN